MNRNGQPFVFLVVLVGLLVMGLAIAVLMKPLNVVYNHMYTQPELQEDIYQNFFIKSQTVWSWLAGIFGFGIILWGIVEGSRRETGGYYG